MTDRETFGGGKREACIDKPSQKKIAEIEDIFVDFSRFKHDLIKRSSIN